MGKTPISATVLLNKEQEVKVCFAVTLILVESGQVVIPPETLLTGEVFKMEEGWDEAYRMICDAKSQMETLRFSEMITSLFVGTEDKQNESGQYPQAGE